MVQTTNRVWFVPAIFALVGLSLPVQELYARRVSEPYPGLFQPRFSEVLPHDKAVVYSDVHMSVDGRPIDSETLLPQLNSGKRQEVIESWFPPESEEAQVDAESRQTLRSTLEDALGEDPQQLSVTWKRHRFGLESRRTTVLKTLAEYEIDLQDGR